MDQHTDTWGYPIAVGQKVTFPGKEAHGNITYNLGTLEQYDAQQDRWLIKRIYRKRGPGQADLETKPRLIWVATWKISGLPARRAHSGAS